MVPWKMCARYLSYLCALQLTASSSLILKTRVWHIRHKATGSKSARLWIIATSHHCLFHCFFESVCLWAKKTEDLNIRPRRFNDQFCFVFISRTLVIEDILSSNGLSKRLTLNCTGWLWPCYRDLQMSHSNTLFATRGYFEAPATIQQMVHVDLLKRLRFANQTCTKIERNPWEIMLPHSIQWDQLL